MKESSTLLSYNDIWPIVIRQTVSNQIMFGVPSVMQTDEKTIVNQLRQHISKESKYGVIGKGESQFSFTLMMPDRKHALISDVIFCSSRRWSSKDEYDSFMLSMILRGYFERPDCFGWEHSKVLSWFRGGLS